MDLDTASDTLLRQLALGAFLQAHRGALGRSIEAMAAHAGLSYGTWKRVEEGYAVRPKSYAALETALELPTGTIRRALSDHQAMVDLAARLGVDTSAASDTADGDFSFLVSFAGPAWLHKIGRTANPTAAATERVTPPPDSVEPGSVQALINRLVRTPDRTPAEEGALQALVVWVDELVANRGQ